MMNWGALISAFGLVFVAELGDKTQLAVMTQTCKFRRPLPVFIGASLALSAVTALGVLGGQVLGEFVPANVINTVAAVAFVVMGVWVWIESTRVEPEEDLACSCEGDEAFVSRNRSHWDWQAFGATLTLLFLAELGDKTQLAVLGLTSKQAAPWLVFAGGASALTCVTALGVLGGQQLCRLISQQLLLKISAVAFVVLGILMGLGVL
jgi:putative Ca2+/H+ antiporter (TMEM165/GDT1 family)